MATELPQKLLKIASAWLDPRYPLRQQAVASAASEFCLSPASFEWALDWIFSLWTEAIITKKLEQNPFKQRRYAVQVLAGTTPAMIAQGFLQGAILTIPQYLKIPSQQPTFAKLLHQSFAEIAPVLARLFESGSEAEKLPRFYSQLSQADLVFIYGQDETVETLKKYLAPKALLLAHGHAESVAVIFKEAARLSSLESLAYDFLSYDQRGCLSPGIVLIEEGGELSPADCTRVFAETVLPPLVQRFPRGGLFAGEAEEILHQRSLYGFRGQVYGGEDWTVCFDEKPDWPTMALPRFLPMKAFANSAELKVLLKPVRKNLICLGYAGPEIRLKELELNSTTGLSPLGEMQKQLLVF